MYVLHVWFTCINTWACPFCTRVHVNMLLFGARGSDQDWQYVHDEGHREAACGLNCTTATVTHFPHYSGEGGVDFHKPWPWLWSPYIKPLITKKKTLCKVEAVSSRLHGQHLKEFVQKVPWENESAEYFNQNKCQYQSSWWEVWNSIQHTQRA